MANLPSQGITSIATTGKASGSSRDMRVMSLRVAGATMSDHNVRFFNHDDKGRVVERWVTRPQKVNGKLAYRPSDLLEVKIDGNAIVVTAPAHVFVSRNVDLAACELLPDYKLPY